MILILEVLGLFVFFGLLGLLSLIIVPSIFGCLGFILFWAILLSLIVFLSINIGWFILIVLAIYVLLAISKYFRYRALPEYDIYLTDNQNIYENGQLHCKFCGSHNTVYRGLFGKNSNLSYYVCLKCRQWLCKFKEL